MQTPLDLFVLLRDGRKLAYREYGNRDGKAVLYFHGHPGSRLDLAMFDPAILAASGLRLIAIDRPGIGKSDFKPNRKLTDWPQDVREFADALKLDHFAVMGMSGGGPFAAVCARFLPERVCAATILSGVGRFDLEGATTGMGSGKAYFRLSRHLPLLARLQMSMMGYGLKSSPQRVIAQMTAELPPADQAVLQTSTVREGFLLTVSESLRQGAKALVAEGGIYAQPWGFRLEEIRMPVSVWHGDADRNAPVMMGHQTAAVIPGCKTHFVHGEGHFSLAVHHMAEILQEIAAD